MSRTWRVAWFVAWLSFMASCAALILGSGSITLSLVLMTVLFALTTAPLEHRRRRLTAAPAPAPRPDADVAQYLNDADREWLAGHDWQDPALDRIRITDNGGTPHAFPTVGEQRAKPRKAVSSVTDNSGWRTVECSDGTREEYAVTDFARTQRLAAEVTAMQDEMAVQARADARAAKQAQAVVKDLTRAAHQIELDALSGHWRVRDAPPSR